MGWDGVARVDELDDWFRVVAVESAPHAIYTVHGESLMNADLVPAMADAAATHTVAGFHILVSWPAASEAVS